MIPQRRLLGDPDAGEPGPRPREWELVSHQARRRAELLGGLGATALRAQRTGPPPPLCGRGQGPAAPPHPPPPAWAAQPLQVCSIQPRGSDLVGPPREPRGGSAEWVWGSPRQLHLGHAPWLPPVTPPAAPQHAPASSSSSSPRASPRGTLHTLVELLGGGARVTRVAQPSQDSPAPRFPHGHHASPARGSLLVDPLRGPGVRGHVT